MLFDTMKETLIFIFWKVYILFGLSYSWRTLVHNRGKQCNGFSQGHNVFAGTSPLSWKEEEEALLKEQTNKKLAEAREREGTKMKLRPLQLSWDNK